MLRLTTIFLASLLAGGPLFAQEPAGMSSAPVEAPAAEAETEEAAPALPFGLDAETVELLLSYTPRKPSGLPNLRKREDYVGSLQRTYQGFARRMKLDADAQKSFMELVEIYIQRRQDEIEAAHRRLPDVMKLVADQIAELSPDCERESEEFTLLCELLIDTLRYRIEDHVVPVVGETRRNSFKALMLRTEQPRETVFAACLELRRSLEEQGNPWNANTLIGRHTRECDDAVKLILNPEQHAQFLELRGLVRQASWEAVGTKQFAEQLATLGLGEATLKRARQLATEPDVAADIRFERVVQLVGADRQADLTKALNKARDAVAAAKKAEAATAAASKA